MIPGRSLVLLALVAGAAEPAYAQINGPLHGFVADARGVLARFKEDPAIASLLAVAPANLPTRGLGLAFGAHWYPVRLRGVTLGLGGELMLARATRTLEPEEDSDPDPDEPPVSMVPGPSVTTRMTAVSPHVSLNFGRENGWSYISGGVGVAGFTAERVEQPLGDPQGRARTTHYGGGARWFTKKHLALSVDFRFYSIAEQPAALARPAFPRMRIMVISVGAAFR